MKSLTLKSAPLNDSWPFHEKRLLNCTIQAERWAQIVALLQKCFLGSREYSHIYGGSWSVITMFSGCSLSSINWNIVSNSYGMLKHESHHVPVLCFPGNLSGYVLIYPTYLLRGWLSHMAFFSDNKFGIYRYTGEQMWQGHQNAVIDTNVTIRRRCFFFGIQRRSRITSFWVFFRSKQSILHGWGYFLIRFPADPRSL